MQNQPNPPAVSSLSDDPNYQNHTFARDLSKAMLRNHPNHQLVSLHQLSFGEILFLICFVSRQDLVYRRKSSRLWLSSLQDTETSAPLEHSTEPPAI